MRRGLTLIEVVVAAALLTLIVAACLPLIAVARRDLDAARTAETIDAGTDPADAIDELVRQRPGLVSDLLEAPGGLPLHWTSRDQDYEAVARLAAEYHASDDERRSSHAWVVFRVEGVDVPRWMRLPAAPRGPNP